MDAPATTPPLSAIDRSASVLLVSADQLLVSEVLRLAAAAGVVPEVADHVPAALRGWSRAGVVLVGADLAGDLSDAAPARRDRVQVISTGRAPDDLFRWALRLGAETVAELPRSDTWLVELLTDVGDGAVSPGRTIGVVGGAGGAGASVFAAALAGAATVHGSALVVDLDPIGAGLDRVLGVEALEGVRWDGLHQVTGRLSARSLRDALPRRDGLAVLGWPTQRDQPLQAFAVREVLSAARRGFDAVVLDLPRHPDPLVEEVLTRCDEVVVVCPPTVAAVTAASRLVRRLPLTVGRSLVTRGTGGVPAEDMATILGCTLLATMTDQRGLDEAIDLGLGPLAYRRGALSRAARQCAGALLAPRAVAA